MQALCSKDCGPRPFACGRAPEEASARLFLCKRCRAQVLICSHCDRGHVYCDGGCAAEARWQSRWEAGERYQASRKGRLAHAARQVLYRARKRMTYPATPADLVSAEATAFASRSGDPGSGGPDRGQRRHAERPAFRREEKKVTHHGSLRRPADDFKPADAAGRGFSHCHWCGCRLSPFVRVVFLRR